MQDRNSIYGRLTQAFVKFAGEVCARTLQQGVTALDGMAGRATAAAEQARCRAEAEALRTAQAVVQERFVRRLQDKFRRFALGEDLSDEETLGAQPEEWSRELVRAVEGVTNSVAAPLWHLNMRMALLRGGYKTGDYGNPLGPGQLFGSLAWALAGQPLPLRVQLLLCRLLERQLPERLVTFHEALNQRLAAHGLFPHLRYQLVEAMRSANRSETAESALDEDAAVVAARVERSLQAAMATLIRAQSAQRDQPLRATALGNPFASLQSDGRDDSDSLGPMDIAFALAGLQARHPLPEGRVNRALPTVAVLEAKAIECLARAGAGNGRPRLRRLTAEAFVRSGRLFAGITQDAYLTAELRQLLGYLYLPMLRIGLLEGRFWTDPGHPARRLLGLLVELGEFWVGAERQDRVVYPQMHATVAAVCHDYLDDTAVLQPILHDLEAFAERMGQRARMTLARSLAAERGQARRGSAQSFCREEAARRLAVLPLSADQQRSLQIPLADCLAALLLRGALPEAQVQALLQALLQALAALAVADGAARPAAEAALQACLQALANPPAARALWQAALVLSTAGAAAVPLVPVADSAAGTTATGHAQAFLQALPGQGFGLWFAVTAETADAASEAVMAAAEQVQEAVVPEGAVEVEEVVPPRLWRLVWASPVPRHYLFVNRLGIRMAVLDEAALAARLAAGQWVPLPAHGNAWARAVTAGLAV